MSLTWRAPGYEGDRHVALAGEISVGAVFPPIGQGQTAWRWRFWLGGNHAPEGKAPNEAQAKAAVAMRFLSFLDQAALEARVKAVTP